MTERDADPFGAHRFRVTCDVLPPLGFTEVRGLAVRVVDRDEDHSSSGLRDEGDWRRPACRSAGVLPTTRRTTRSPTLELRRGVTDDRALWDWLQSWVAGDVELQDVRVCLLDGRGRPVRGWVCRGARPVRWAGPDLDAERATVATETLELTHDGIVAVTDLAECEE